MTVNEHVLVSTLLVAFDLGGTFVFALSGATAGVKHRVDLFWALACAVAAVIGAAVLVPARMLHLPSAAAAAAGAVLCCGLRLVAMRRVWQLPIARSLKQPDPETSVRSDGQ